MEDNYFVCELHEEAYLTVEEWKQHVLQHHKTEEVSFHCEVCNKRFKTELQMKRHKVREHHTKILNQKNKVKASNSEVKIKIEPFEIKVETNPTVDTTVTTAQDNENLLQCHICSETFYSEATLSLHLVVHVKNDPELNINVNQSMIKLENPLESLIKLEHHDNDVDPLATFSDEVTEDEDEDFQDDPADKDYNPNECSDEIQVRAYCDDDDDDIYANCSTKINPESDASEDLNEQKCGQEERIAKKNFRYRNPLSRKYKCYFCSKNYSSSKDVEVHTRLHTQERPFKCQVCDNWYQDDSVLRRHVETHSTERQFSCHLCTAVFRRANGVTRHCQSVHSNKKPFKCTVCPSRFNRKDLLVKHLNDHKNGTPPSKKRVRITTYSDNRPYPCSQCDNWYTKEAILVRHILAVHSERQFKCKLCHKKFATRLYLKNHVVTIHATVKPFKCEFCFKEFGRKSIHQAHVKSKSHQGDTPFECFLCKQKFATLDDLTTHRTTHTSLINYKV